MSDQVKIPSVPVMADYCLKRCLEAKLRMLGMKVVREGGKVRVDIMEENEVTFGPLAGDEREALYLAVREYFG